MRVAIVHHWLLGLRGGEKVLEALCEMLPQADIFTLFYEPGSAGEVISKHRIQSSFLNPMRRFHRALLPLMPVALESLDLRDYDLVISIESGPAKGVITKAETRHVCYCNTPMRYLWQLYPEHLHDWSPRATRWLMAPIANYLRLWDYASAARVDTFVANSVNVQRRIWKTYRRESTVVHPPVNVDEFRWEPAHDYYLAVSELVAYKRLDEAVRWFSSTGRSLKIVGDGPEYKKLKGIAGPSVAFCGRVSSDGLRTLYARCRAFVMPGEEDFGIAAVEAAASGKAVIALGRGGVLESIPPSGVFLYSQPTEHDLAEAVAQFERAENSIRPAELQAHARTFAPSEFARKMCEVLGLTTGMSQE